MPSGKPDIKVFRRVWPYLHPYRAKIALGVGLLLISTPLGSAHPLIWKYIVDDVVGLRHVNHLWPALLAMFAIQGTATLLDAMKSILLERVGQKFVFDLRSAVYQKLQSQSLAYLSDNRTGDLISRAMSDVDVLQEVAFQSIDSVLGNTLSFLVVAGILIHLNAKLGVVTLLPIVVVFFLTRFFNTRVKAIYRQARDRLGEVNARLQENLTGLTLIKAFAKERYETERFQGVARRLYADEFSRHLRPQHVLSRRALHRLFQQHSFRRLWRVARPARAVYRWRVGGVSRLLVAAFQSYQQPRDHQRTVAAGERGGSARV